MMFNIETLRLFLIINWLGWSVSGIIWIMAGDERWFSRAALSCICLCGFAIFEAVNNLNKGE